jgi:hypothetical protein
VAATPDGKLATILLDYLDDGGDLGRYGRRKEADRLNILDLSSPVGINGSVGIVSIGR